METLISAKNLNKTFSMSGRDLHVLKDVSLEINKGEMTALMGPSGVGKSTLLHILGALDRPSSGEVLYEEKNIFDLKNDDLAGFRSRAIGFVFQFHHLLPEFNTIENIIMPALIAGKDYGDAREKAELFLNDVGLADRSLHKPGELSGGEQQRVAVARALMLDPMVVLADEPTGNLDTQTGEEIFSLLKEFNKKGITFIIVTHNEDIASQCEKNISMKDGRII